MPLIFSVHFAVSRTIRLSPPYADQIIQVFLGRPHTAINAYELAQATAEALR